MSTQKTSHAGPALWSADNWAAFWSAPDPQVAKLRVPAIVRDDVVAYWPADALPLRGKQQYVEAVVLALELAPDLRLQREDWATNGDLTFIRWSGAGTRQDGTRFVCRGVDCIRLREGQVIENRIFSDSDLFVQLARLLADRFGTAGSSKSD
jgi:ketosteroid isomerase-like protein